MFIVRIEIKGGSFMQEYEFEDDEELTVLLTLEDDTELECDVILIFELEGQDYVALYPSSGEPDEIYLFRCTYNGGDDLEIEDIEDEDEYNSVAEAFDQIMEEDEWNDLLGYDD